MKKNLKLTLICITILMVICSNFTTMAQEPISFVIWNGGFLADSQNPKVPRRGDTLFYSVWTSQPTSDVEITQFRITYSFPDEILSFSAARNHGGHTDPGKRTITRTFSPTKKIRGGTFSSIAEFVTVAIAAGTGEIRITGTVTTTQGTFNVDSRLSVTIAPTLTDPAPATATPQPTTMADNRITYYGVTSGQTTNPDTPQVGDTLVYYSVITTGVTDLVGDIPDTIIGCKVTYSIIPGPRAPGAIIRWQQVSYGSNVELDANALKGTFTFTVSDVTPRSLLVIFRDFTVEAVGVGTGEIRMTGTVTTTRGTFNIVEEPLFITIAPSAVPPEPAIAPPPAEDVVSIPDAKLAAGVRKALSLGANAFITKQAMQRLTKLDARESQIKNLTGLEHATRLEFLELRKNQITDIRPLTNLKSLKELILEVNNVRDIRPLANLTQLTLLYIAANPISDFTPLTNLTDLRRLSLWDNDISGNVTLVANMNHLTHLHLWNCNLSDITLLANLTQLKVLHLEHNQIRNVTPLANLTQLEELTLRGNPIQDKSPLSMLKARNPNLKLDIEIPPLSPVVHLEAAQRPPMYWIDAKPGTLHRLIGDEVENLVPNVKNATSLAVDMMGGKLYWTEKTGERTGRIRGANLDGTNVKLVKNLTSVPHSIALDAANGKLYWANGWGKIQRMDLDGSNFQANLITNLNAPRHLALDVAGGKIYWTETTEGLRRIRRANLDGSSVQYVVNNLAEPVPLAVSNGKLYWTNGTRENKGELQRADLNGFNREVLETLPIVPTSIAVDPVRNSLYLTIPSGEIHRRNLDGSGDQPIVTNLASPSNIVLGISATDPVATDTPIPPAEPAGDTAADVNGDKKVNKTDLLLVITALGESPPANPNFDVNADGTVDIADVLLVIEALDDPVAAAAPSFGETLTALDPAQLAKHIAILRAESDGSMKYAHAIAFFQSLLASVRPTETQLLANYPNPFNPETWIPYQLAKPSNVKVTIYDGRGVVVRQLVLGHQASGFYTSRSRAAYWDGRNALGERVASGVYFYVLSAGDFTATRKMLILK